MHHFLLFTKCFLPFKRQVMYPFPKRKILDSSELKDFAGDNFKFDENGKKLSKRVENTVGKDLYNIHVKTRACFGKG